MAIALIGGGKAALTLLDYFVSLDSVRVAGLADPREDAPGAVRARELGIATTTDTEELISQRQVTMVVEVTGVAKVREIVLSKLRPDQDIMTAAGARLVCEMIDFQNERNASAAQDVSGQFSQVSHRCEIALDSINSSRADITRVLRETQMIAINGTIEAARAGDAGRSFGVVVERMSEMLNQMQDTMSTIAQAAVNSQEGLEQLNTAENNLLTLLGAERAVA